MDQRMEARAVLRAVYWSCQHGWLFKFLYGEREGSAVAAAEWYVQRHLLPTCLEKVGSVVCNRSITVEVTAHLCWEKTLPHPQDDLEAGALAVQETPVMQTQIGGSSSSSSAAPLCVPRKRPGLDLDAIPEEDAETESEDDAEAAQHETEYWCQRVLWESQYGGTPQFLVHFMTMTGTVMYTKMLPWHATLQYVEYVLNKELFFLLESWERFELAVRGWRHTSVGGSGLARGPRRLISRGEVGFDKVELKDVDCVRTDDWQIFLTVVRTRRDCIIQPR